jgi:hypothetical protein
MRLLSIFALVFLMSYLLHGGLKDRAAPDEQAGQDTEEVANAADVMDATDAADEAEVEPEEMEDFSSLIFSQPPYPVRHFDFEQEPAFNARTVEIEMKNLIIGRNDDGHKITNHFCAVGYEFPRQARRKGTARREVVVYWKEGQMLYRWRGGDPNAAQRDFYDARTLLMYATGIPLDPAQGVTGEHAAEEGKFDNYKERAENVIADCEKHGRSYEIEPFAPPPRGFKPPPPRPRPSPRPSAPPAAPEAPSAPETPSSSPVVESPRNEWQEPHSTHVQASRFVCDL